jgi:hypothetical protein
MSAPQQYNSNPLEDTDSLAYDQWLSREVQSARAGLADGSNHRFTPDEWAAIRAAKKAYRDTL